MASVMNLAGYVAVGRGHHQGDVFTMISVHILGMYGLILSSATSSTGSDDAGAWSPGSS